MKPGGTHYANVTAAAILVILMASVVARIDSSNPSLKRNQRNAAVSSHIKKEGKWSRRSGESPGVRVVSTSGGKSKGKEVDSAQLADLLNGTTVTVQLGGSAQLRCPFGGVSEGDATSAISGANDTYPNEEVVSWIRRKDMHPLTVGHTVYSSDKRFHPVKTRHSPEWRLEIMKVREEDSGTYECLLSTDPPQSIFIHLNIVEAEAMISGGPDIYLRAGSVLKLRCDLLKSTEPPEFVFWYRGDRMVNYDAKSHKHNIVVEMIDSKTSVLTIPTITKLDSGNFTCVPANAKPASVMVHVLDGEKPAAMQHEATSAAGMKTRETAALAIFPAIIAALLTANVSCRSGCGGSSLMIAR